MESKNNHPSRPTLTVMEGREENIAIVNDLASAARKRGWGFYHLRGIDSDQISHFNFSDIPLDFVIFRELSRNNYHEVERVLSYMHKKHAITVNANPAGGRVCSSDKHFQQGMFQLDPFLREYALPTFEAKSRQNVLELVRAGKIGYPFLLKARRGSTGDDIFLVRSESDLAQYNNLSSFLVEKYIEPECDWRVFVIGGVAVGAMRKIGDRNNPGNFKLWSRGVEKYPEENPEILATIADLAVRAAAAHGLEYAGVDIIKSAKTGKYYILETNIAAGWSNRFIETTHINVPDLLIDYLEARADAKGHPVGEQVENYINPRLKYLPEKIQKSYRDILEGIPDAPRIFVQNFAKYPYEKLPDAGFLFGLLNDIYDDLIKNPQSDPQKYRYILHMIESLPLSWAGNFIGPNVGTLHDGAILSALYLFLLGKIEKV